MKICISIIYSICRSGMLWDWTSWPGAHFELRTLYNFRQRLSQHMQETRINLLDQAFEKVTNAQIEVFQMKKGQQRMDSDGVWRSSSPDGARATVVEVCSAGSAS